MPADATARVWSTVEPRLRAPRDSVMDGTRLTSALRRVAMVQAEGVAVRIAEKGHVADAGVKFVDELDSPVFQLGNRALEVVHVKRDRVRAWLPLPSHR